MLRPLRGLMVGCNQAVAAYLMRQIFDEKNDSFKNATESSRGVLPDLQCVRVHRTHRHTQQ
jgi:hypothetical protein